MRGFAVYWNTRSTIELGSLPLDQLLKEMGRYEEITAPGGQEPLTYIVSPVTLEVKLTHNEGSADPATPAYVGGMRGVECVCRSLGVIVSTYLPCFV